MHPRPTTDPGSRSALVALALVMVGLCACKSASAHREDADRDVYEIIEERRAELDATDAFSIDAPEGSLRERLLAGALDEEPLPPLTLVDCLEIAAENSRDWQDRRESLYVVALQLTRERWEFSVKESGVLGAALSGDGNAARTANFFSAIGLDKLLKTGAFVMSDFSVDLMRDVSRGDGWDAIGNFSVNITQPLLRGFGSAVVREPLTQAERNVLYEARAYERFRRTFGFDVGSRYYRILAQVDTLENERANVELARRLRERNEEFARAGRMTDIQVDQARQNELDAENRVIDALESLERSLDDLKLFLGLPVVTELVLDPTEHDRLEELLGSYVEPTEDQAIAIGLRERLDHQTNLDRVDDAVRGLEVLADALRAGLDVGVDVRSTSEEGRPLGFRASRLQWTGAVSLDLPLDRLTERNAYRVGLIDLEASARAAEESADTIAADLRDALRQLRSARESYEIQRNAVLLAERRVESAQLNLEAGRAETRDLLEAQQDLVRTRNATTNALTDFTLAGIALYRDMELLRVTDEGISVDTTPFEDPVLEETP